MDKKTFEDFKVSVLYAIQHELEWSQLFDLRSAVWSHTHAREKAILEEGQKRIDALIEKLLQSAPDVEG